MGLGLLVGAVRTAGSQTPPIKGGVSVTDSGDVFYSTGGKCMATCGAAREWRLAERTDSARSISRSCLSLLDDAHTHEQAMIQAQHDADAAAAAHDYRRRDDQIRQSHDESIRRSDDLHAFGDCVKQAHLNRRTGTGNGGKDLGRGEHPPPGTPPPPPGPPPPPPPGDRTHRPAPPAPPGPDDQTFARTIDRCLRTETGAAWYQSIPSGVMPSGTASYDSLARLVRINPAALDQLDPYTRVYWIAQAYAEYFQKLEAKRFNAGSILQGRRPFYLRDYLVGFLTHCVLAKDYLPMWDETDKDPRLLYERFLAGLGDDGTSHASRRDDWIAGWLEYGAGLPDILRHGN